MKNFKQKINKENIKLNLIDNNKAVEIFDVTKQTLYNWRKSGKVKFRKIGGKVFYLLDELLKKTNVMNNINGGNYEK